MGFLLPAGKFGKTQKDTAHDQQKKTCQKDLLPSHLLYTEFVALPAFHYQCLAMLLHPIIVVANMTFQSVGASGRATFLACCRQGVFFIPLILILPRTHGLFGVEICQPIADVLTFLVSLPFLIAFLQQLGRMDDAEQSKTAS